MLKEKEESNTTYFGRNGFKKSPKYSAVIKDKHWVVLCEKVIVATWSVSSKTSGAIRYSFPFPPKRSDHIYVLQSEKKSISDFIKQSCNVTGYDDKTGRYTIDSPIWDRAVTLSENHELWWPLTSLLSTDVITGKLYTYEDYTLWIRKELIPIVRSVKKAKDKALAEAKKTVSTVVTTAVTQSCKAFVCGPVLGLQDHSMLMTFGSIAQAQTGFNGWGLPSNMMDWSATLPFGSDGNVLFDPQGVTLKYNVGMRMGGTRRIRTLESRKNLGEIYGRESIGPAFRPS